ncbi:MAG: hypothetical protein ACI4OP_03100 [Candidatus Coprovivens sp.]
MEQALKIIATGNPLTIVALLAIVIVYLVIKYERKGTAEKRDKENADLVAKCKSHKEKIDNLEETVDVQRTIIQELQVQNELQDKDIEYIKNEQIDVKSDIKEIKATLNTIAIALERIAAKYDKD